MKQLMIFISMFFLFLSVSETVCKAQGEMQRIEIPSSFNPVGSGARALGMGGAFIAVADDATAASWNPGGLIRLDRPEISVVGAGFHRMEDNSFGLHPEADGEESVSRVELNYLSAAYPFRFIDYNMVVSLNYQHLYDFTRKWNFSFQQDAESLIHADYQSQGKLSAVALAYCVQITENISLGATVNIWDDGLTENSWNQELFQWGSGNDSRDETDERNDFVEEIRIRDEYDFSGYNFNIGILWKNAFDLPLTLGAVIKTPFEADLDYHHSFYRFTQYPNLPSDDDEKEFRSDKENAELDMPLSYGIGLAYRFSDNFTMSLDVYRTQWDDFILKKADGSEISPITGKSATQSDIDPTHQVRIGGEYLGFQTADYVFPLCFGAFYDPAPAPGSPDDFFGLTLGTGISDRKHFTFDMAYQYRFGKSVGEYILEDWNFSQDVQEHTLYASLIIYF
jgi:long-subunit fatty acid transport protein